MAARNTTTITTSRIIGRRMSRTVQPEGSPRNTHSARTRKSKQAGLPKNSRARAGRDRDYDSPVLAGAHVSTSGGIHTALDRAEALGVDAVQIFTQSPRAWRPTNHDPANFERFKERRAEVGHRRGLLPRALPHQPRRARRHRLREVAGGAREHPRRRLRDRSGRSRRARRLAPGRGPRGRARARRSRRSRRRSNAARTSPGSCSRTRPARAGRSAAPWTSSRSSSSASAPTPASASASTPAISGSRAPT